MLISNVSEIDLTLCVILPWITLSSCFDSLVRYICKHHFVRYFLLRLVFTTSVEWSILCLFYWFFYFFPRLNAERSKKSMKEIKNTPFTIVAETSFYWQRLVFCLLNAWCDLNYFKQVFAFSYLQSSFEKSNI